MSKTGKAVCMIFGTIISLVILVVITSNLPLCLSAAIRSSSGVLIGWGFMMGYIIWSRL